MYRCLENIQQFAMVGQLSFVDCQFPKLTIVFDFGLWATMSSDEAYNSEQYTTFELAYYS